jgi:hypothetical protein
VSFSLTPLVGDRVLVKGEDIAGTSGSCVVDSSQWNAIKQDGNYNQAVEAFDEAVDAFFAPLLEAAAVLEDAVDPEVPEDSVRYVVLKEEVEGTPAQSAHIVELTSDSVILRLIEDGQDSRLLWVNGTLEVIDLVSAIADGS